MSIASNSPRLATYARPASQTCSLPSLATTPATRPARLPVRLKERRDEYAIGRHGATRSERSCACSDPGGQSLLLVRAARIVGEPFALPCASRRRGAVSGWVPDQ